MRSTENRYTKMNKFTLGLLVVLGVAIARVYAFDDVTSLIKPFCSFAGPEDSDIMSKAEACADELPEIAKKTRDECAMKVTGTSDRKEFLNILCKEDKEFGDLPDKMRECLFKKQSEITITADDLEKTLEVVRCLRVVMHTNRR